MRIWTFALLMGVMLAGSAGLAQPISQAELKALIESEGSNVAPESRTVVTVEECIIQIDVYRPYQAAPDDLWSSFRADIQGITMPVADAETGDRFRYTEDIGGAEPPIAFLFFQMQPPFLARHEQPLYRNPEPPFTPSPREGALEYVYQERTDFFVIQYDQANPRKSRRFTTALMQYRREFCLVLS